MHMSLRRTIRLPQRLEHDQVHMPVSRRIQREDNRKLKCIDFDPTLPPAAFPTLDRPGALEADGQEAQQNGKTGSGRVGTARRNAKPLEVLPLSPSSEHQRVLSPTDNLNGLSLDRIDNVIASNGDRNPIWVSNMRKMGSAGEESNGDVEMKDNARVVSQSSSAGFRDPDWTDLSHRMQAAIFDNMLERWSYATVCRMLDLTSDELKAVKQTLKCRREQAKYEDGQLGAMRAKQLRELSKVDNSIRRRCQSQPLLFRKASRQTFRGLKEAIDPDTEYFSCEASELATAKAFLRRRGIEIELSGIWGNGTFVIENFEEDEEDVLEPFGLDGGPGPSLVTGFDQTWSEAGIRHMKPSYQSEPSSAMKEAFANWIGSWPTGIRSLYPRRVRDARPPRPVRERDLAHLCRVRIASEEQFRYEGNRNQGIIDGCRYMCSTSQQDGAATGSSNSDHATTFMNRLFDFDKFPERSNSEPPSECAEPRAPTRHVPSNDARERTEIEQDTQMQGPGQENNTQESQDVERAQVSDSRSATSTPVGRPIDFSSTPEIDIGLLRIWGLASPRTASRHSTPPTSVSDGTTTEDDDEMVLLPTCDRR